MPDNEKLDALISKMEKIIAKAQTSSKSTGFSGVPVLPGAGGYFDFPHTNYYDQDLGWLIKFYLYIAKEYEHIKATVDRLEELYDTIPDQIKAEVKIYMDVIRQEIDELTAKINAQMERVETTLEDLQDQIIQFQKLIGDIVNTMGKLREELQQYSDAGDEAVKKELYDYINNLSFEFPLVRCPVDGRMEPIQTCLDHMFNAQGFGISAQEFDNINIPAQDFDEIKITAHKFDSLGLYYLEKWKDRYNLYMYSPFTGEWMSMKQVILQLADFHLDAVTAQELDDAMVTAEEFDNGNVTGYEFDSSKDWLTRVKPPEPEPEPEPVN